MISVILPVLDEEALVAAAVLGVPTRSGDEVLVADGGSRDATREAAGAAGAVVVEAPRGRALQMNAGAARARGDALLFLHVDVRLPPGALAAVEAALADPAVVGGGFAKVYPGGGPWLAASAWLQNTVRSGLLGHLVGTNAIFVRRTVFEAIGGFAPLPFLEDVVFSDALRARGRVAVLPGPVEVSPRRYHARGTLAAMARNVAIMARYRILGQDPRELAALYRGK